MENSGFHDPVSQLHHVLDAYYGIYLLDVANSLVIPLKPAPEFLTLFGTTTQPWRATALLDQTVDPRDLENLRTSLSVEAVRDGFSQLTECRVMQYRKPGGGWMKVLLQPYAMHEGKTSLALLTFLQISEPLSDQPLQDVVSLWLRVNLSTDRVEYARVRAGEITHKMLSKTWSEYYKELLQAIHPGDCNAVAMRTHPSILLGLPDGDEISCTFRAKRGDNYLRYFMAIHKIVEADKSQVLKVYIEHAEQTTAAE